MAAEYPPSSVYELPILGLLDQSTQEYDTKIRVFDLHLDQPDSANIIGTLRVVDIRSDPKPMFTALSYCWSQAPSDRCTHLPKCARNPKTQVRGTITCNNDFKIAVPWNCIDALWHLRKACRQDSARGLLELPKLTIWIDSICIDQNNNAEKDNQIPLMKDIYTLASTTYFWLGSGSAATDAALDHLSAIGTKSLDQSLEERRTKLDFTMYSYQGLVSKLTYRDRLAFLKRSDFDIGLILRHSVSIIFGNFRRPFFRELDELLSLPWIQRLWTFQEAFLSDRAEILCGDRRLPWVIMVFALEFMKTHTQFSSGLLYPPAVEQWHRLSVSWLKSNKERKHSGLQVLIEVPYTEKSLKAVTIGAALENQTCAIEFRIQYTAEIFKGIVDYSTLVLYGASIVFAVLPWLDLNKALKNGIWRNNALSWAFNISNWSIMSLFAILRAYKSSNIDVSPPAEQPLITELLRRDSQFAQDKYFALYGIIGKDGSSYLTQASDIGNIYKQLSMDLVRYTDSLEILLYVPGLGNMVSRESWVVDWRNPPEVWANLTWKRSYSHKEVGFVSFLRNPLRMFSGAQGYIPEKILERYKGPLGYHSRYEDTPYKFNEGALCVKGVVAGQLCSSYRFIPFEHSGQSSAEDQYLHDSVGSFQDIAYAIHEQEREKFFEYLGNIWMLSSNGKPMHREAGIEWTSFFINTLKNMSENDVESLQRHDIAASRRRLAQPFPWWRRRGALGITSGAAWKYHTELVNFLVKEKLAVFDFQDITPWEYNNGRRYGGVAPQGIERNDVVALLVGVRMPMILRPNRQGSSFSIVGPAFIPGMMDDERSLIALQEPNKSSLEILRLV